jgi:hypothetical protein
MRLPYTFGNGTFYYAFLGKFVLVGTWKAHATRGSSTVESKNPIG